MKEGHRNSVKQQNKNKNKTKQAVLIINSSEEVLWKQVNFKNFPIAVGKAGRNQLRLDLYEFHFKAFPAISPQFYAIVKEINNIYEIYIRIYLYI